MIGYFVFIAFINFWLFSFTSSGCAQDAYEIGLQKLAVSKLPKIPEGLNEKYYVVRERNKTVLTSYDFRYSSPNFNVLVYSLALPKPPHNHPSQVVKEWRVSPGTKPLRDRSVLNRPMVVSSKLLERGEDQHNIRLQIDMKVDLYSRKLSLKGEGEVKVEKLNELQHLKALVPMRSINYMNKQFRDWVKEEQLERKSKEGEVEFGKRVYLFLVDYFEYKYFEQQDRKLNTVIREKKTDCAGMSAVFVGVMRHNGIPARVLAGRWAKSSVSGRFMDQMVNTQQHVIAEFYAHGVGWVPLDLASGRGTHKAERRLKHFGSSPADFIILHIDTDFKYRVPGMKERESPLMQIPGPEMLGSGTMKGVERQEKWTVSAPGGTAK